VALAIVDEARSGCSLLTSARRHVTRILAYALAFIAVMLAIETFPGAAA
jgi:hypothetical protein